MYDQIMDHLNLLSMLLMQVQYLVFVLNLRYSTLYVGLLM